MTIVLWLHPAQQALTPSMRPTTLTKYMANNCVDPSPSQGRSTQTPRTCSQAMHLSSTAAALDSCGSSTFYYLNPFNAYASKHLFSGLSQRAYCPNPVLYCSTSPFICNASKEVRRSCPWDHRHPELPRRITVGHRCAPIKLQATAAP
jgi:hypothetical protein